MSTGTGEMTGAAIVPAPRAGSADLRRSPTADLYLGFALDGAPDAPPVERLSPTLLRMGDALVVVRHPGAWPRRLPPHRRLVAILDDDVEAGVGDDALPLAYRAKLAAVDRPGWRRVAGRADLALASTPALAARICADHPRLPVAVAGPAWPADWPSAPRARADAAAPLDRIALTMGLSHARDAAPLMPVLARLLDRRPALHLTVSGALGGLRAVADHPRVTVVPERGWTEWRRAVRAARYDLALVPHLAGGAFNAARSGAKLGEHAAAGAAVMGSAGWAAGDAAAAAGRALSVAGGAEAWEQAISRALDDPEGTRAIARRNAVHLARGAAAARLRALWEMVAGGAPGAAVAEAFPG